MPLLSRCKVSAIDKSHNTKIYKRAVALPWTIRHLAEREIDNFG
jgi:hypothetical protein